MKKFPVRRLLAGILTVVLLLGVLTACGKEEEKKPVVNKEPISQNPYVAGAVLLSYQAEVSISYDKDGLVLYVEGLNSAGMEVAGKFSQSLGKSCTEAMAEVIGLILDSDSAPELSTIVLKQVLGSETPSDSFLADLETAIQAAAEGCTIFTIPADELDDLGYLSFETVDAILRTALALDEALTFPGTPYQISGLFSFTVPIDGQAVEYCVDANTGTVATAESLGLAIDTEEYIPEPDIPEDPFGEYPDEVIMDMPEM